MTDGRRKVALITGGGTGVGAASARALAARGFDVAINYSRSASEAETTVGTLRDAGAEAIALQGSVADDADCRRLVADALSRFGRLDALVNSAGATQFAALDDLEVQNAEDFQRVYAVNLIGPYQMMRAAADPLRASGGGAVVNVSSIAGVNGNGSSIAYIASKGALNTLTLTMARLLAPKVRVNTVLPGLLDTRWLEAGLGSEAFAKVKENFAAQSALGDICTADDVADAVAFLVCDARKMTGQLMPVDAGFLLGRGAKVSK
jgi:3-oxoacyl-[acyl-carrier protein] reductase